MINLDTDVMHMIIIIPVNFSLGLTHSHQVSLCHSLPFPIWQPAQIYKRNKTTMSLQYVLREITKYGL